jgi:hypothetical protein
MLVGAGDLVYFVPPRIYIDLGQNDGDNNLPKGWGFKLETVGALIGRGAIKGTAKGANAPATEPSHKGAIADGEKSFPNPLKPLGLKK